MLRTTAIVGCRENVNHQLPVNFANVFQIIEIEKGVRIAHMCLPRNPIYLACLHFDIALLLTTLNLLSSLMSAGLRLELGPGGRGGEMGGIWGLSLADVSDSSKVKLHEIF